MFNNKYHYSFKTFLHFWLAKIPCIIHPNQLLSTKFGRTLPNVKNDINRAAKLPDYWTVNQDRPGDKNELFWWWLQKAKHFRPFHEKEALARKLLAKNIPRTARRQLNGRHLLLAGLSTLDVFKINIENW